MVTEGESGTAKIFTVMPNGDAEYEISSLGDLDITRFIVDPGLTLWREFSTAYPKEACFFNSPLINAPEMTVSRDNKNWAVPYER